MKDDIEKAINGLEAMLHETTQVLRMGLTDINYNLIRVAEALEKANEDEEG